MTLDVWESVLVTSHLPVTVTDTRELKVRLIHSSIAVSTDNKSRWEISGIVNIHVTSQLLAELLNLG